MAAELVSQATLGGGVGTEEEVATGFLSGAASPGKESWKTMISGVPDLCSGWPLGSKANLGAPPSRG